ncbi:glycosyltransferase [Candidatus Neomarinimicrobiota bacterium]
MKSTQIRKSKLKILFVIPTLNGGGAERVFINYIRSLDQNIYDIVLLLVNRTGEFLSLIPDHVKIVDIGKSKTRHGFFKIIKQIKNIDPELIVSTTNRMNILVLLASFFISRRIKICLYEPSMPSAQFDNDYLPKYYLLLMKLLYRFADYIIAQTVEMKNEILDYYLVNSEKILVTSNPIDTKLIYDSVHRQNNPYNDKYINIVASGRIRDEKGYEFLLNAFIKVIDDNSNYKLYILGNIGDKSYFKKLTKIINENNLNNFVHFLGFQINPFPYYKFADLFVLSSRWEGLPNVVLEALYLKTPVIVTDCILHFRKIIEDGKNGYIVDFGDEINLSQKIQKYSELTVESDVLELPDYNKIFYDMVNGVL